MRQYDLDTEISQTCGSKRHRKASTSLDGSVVIASELRLLQNQKERESDETISRSGSTSHTVHGVRAQAGEGAEVRQWRIGELPQFVAQLHEEDDELAVEATGTTARFYDAVVGQVARVVVVNPHQFKVISQSVKKTDRTDAEQLALYLEKGLLPEVRMKEKQHRELQHWLETRDLLVKQRSALKAKINNLLAVQGIDLKREALRSRKALQRVLAVEAGRRMVKLELRILVEQIAHLNAGIREVEKQIWKKKASRCRGIRT